MFPGEESVAKPRSALRSEDCEHLGFPVFVVGWPQYLALVQGTGNLVSNPRYYCSSPLQTAYVELDHLQHGLHDPVRFLGILVLQHPAQCRRNDLPNQAIFVLEPTAAMGFSAFDEILLQFVDLLLRVTAYEERYGRAEVKWGDAVQCDEFLAVELERRGHDSSFRSRTRVAETRDADNLQILENGRIERHRLLGLAVEPQE
jgi:hypothetical protein